MGVRDKEKKHHKNHQSFVEIGVMRNERIAIKTVSEKFNNNEIL